VFAKEQNVKLVLLT